MNTALFDNGAPMGNDFSTWWAEYGPLVQGSAGLVLVAILLISLAYCSWRRRVDGWLATTVSLLVLVYQSHGMWTFIDRELELPITMKIAGFFVMEAVVLFFAAKARRRFHATLVKDAEGLVVAEGRPGWFGGAVWTFAIGSGFLVGLSEQGTAAFIFRVLIGIVAAAMWWANLIEGNTALDRRKRAKTPTRWRWTPSRIMVKLGLLEPDHDDVTETNRDWLRQNLVRASLLHHQSAWKWRRAVAGQRLTNLSQRADDELLDEVRDQLVLINTIRDRTNPDNAINDAVQAARQAHQDDMAALRTDHETQLSQARATIAELETEASREIESLEAEVARLRPLAEQAEALSRRIEAYASNNHTAKTNGAGSSASASAPSSAADRVNAPQQRSSVPSSPVPTPTQRAAVEPSQVPSSAGTAAVAVEPTMTGKEQLRAAWEALASEGKISGETSTSTLVELGLTVVVAEVSRDSARRYASEWAREKRDSARAAEAASASEGPWLRRIEATPGSD